MRPYFQDRNVSTRLLSKVQTPDSLPDFVVKVDSVDVFKNRLDKYWSYQDLFDYTADITGIGDRSEVTVDIDLS